MLCIVFITSHQHTNRLSRRNIILSLFETKIESSFKVVVVSRLPKLDGFIRSRIYLYTDYRSKYQMTVYPNHRRTGLEKCFRYFRRIFCFDSNHQMDEGILKEALKIACLDKNEENEIEMLRNQISKMADSNNLFNESIQHAVDSIGKTLKSVEKMLAELRNNVKQI